MGEQAGTSKHLQAISLSEVDVSSKACLMTQLLSFSKDVHGAKIGTGPGSQ